MTDHLSELEKSFPHVVEQVVKTWGRQECLVYLESLMVDLRGDRRGFPFTAMGEILLLREIHLEQYRDARRSPDIWGR
jgi:hypothetical protein